MSVVCLVGNNEEPLIVGRPEVSGVILAAP